MPMSRSGFKIWLESSGLDAVLSKATDKHPGVQISAYENKHSIELMQIKVPEDARGGGIGTEIIKSIQEYARSAGKPIVIRPAAEKGRKGDLERFYKDLGFVHNKGRNVDFTLSSPTASTMYWRPE
jgi:GNAT superfamily N-acetyltransferase